MKNLDQFYLIFDELNKNVSEDISTDEIIKATNDLIKYSKNDYTDKSYLKSYTNDNRKPLDEIFIVYSPAV